MRIKNGYNGKFLEIRISNASRRRAELWIESGNKKLPQESLSYIELNELLDLKDEIQKVINNIVGVRNE